MKSEVPDPPVPEAIARLRESRKAMRVRHSFVGVVAAWFLLQGCMFLGRYAAMPILNGWKWRAPLALGSMVLCMLVWVLIVVPLYSLWPRRDPCWHPLIVAGFGAVCGCVALEVMMLCIPWAGPILLRILSVEDFGIAAMMGAVCASVTRVREERHLRHLAVRTNGFEHAFPS